MPGERVSKYFVVEVLKEFKTLKEAENFKKNISETGKSIVYGMLLEVKSDETSPEIKIPQEQLEEVFKEQEGEEIPGFEEIDKETKKPGGENLDIFVAPRDLNKIEELSNQEEKLKEIPKKLEEIPLPPLKIKKENLQRSVEDYFKDPKVREAVMLMTEIKIQEVIAEIKVQEMLDRMVNE